MRKKFFLAVIFLLMALSGTSWGATNNTATSYNPFDYRTFRLSSEDLAGVYSRFGSGYNFFYQLRDITGATRRDQVAGPQWFATVYENYYNNNTANNNNNTGTGIYQRTMGGEIPDVPVSVIGDLVDGFNFVFAEEPQPYSAWTSIMLSNVYDEYPDPLESLCIITTNGQAMLRLKFGNPYAKHFPFWWNWQGTTIRSNWSWWKNIYDWATSASYPTVEPVAYIYDTTDNSIYVRKDDYSYSYEKLYSYTYSDDISTDIVVDTSGNMILKLSGDNYYYDSADKLVYVVSNDIVYDASGNIAYTLETALSSAGTGLEVYTYICEVRNGQELLEFTDSSGNYNINLNPSGEQTIASGRYLDTTISIRGNNSEYGSILTYLGFKQRLSFLQGYTNYREASPIPVVIANVSDGNASDNPLIFDMTVYDVSNKVVNRIKFTWDVQSDKTQDLGTFFMMTPYNATTATPYHIETKITNRTGTRYMLYRYDMMNVGEANSPYRVIAPDYWKYDLTPDEYGTLPASFMLDAQSQIAPGLVTVYDEGIGSGFSTIDMQNDRGASFRLYEYADTTPKNLELTYKRVAGMSAAEAPYNLPDGNGTIQGFSMQFVDLKSDSDNTNTEIRKIVGTASDEDIYSDPAMILSEASTVEPQLVYISSSAMNAFSISKEVDDADFATPPIYFLLETDSPESAEPVVTGPEATLKSIYSSDRVALQPISVRLRIPRSSQLIKDIWENLDNAANPKALFNEFAKVGTVWVRSEAVSALDANMFSAINSKSSYGASDCVRAFIYNDALYLDFIAIIADAESPKDGMTAFIDVIEDDGVPYILIGDGAVDKTWQVSFFVDKTGANPTSDGDTSSGNEQPRTIIDAPIGGGSSGGGGGCNLGLSGIFIAMMAATLFRKK